MAKQEREAHAGGPDKALEVRPWVREYERGRSAKQLRGALKSDALKGATETEKFTESERLYLGRQAQAKRYEESRQDAGVA